MSRSKKKNPVVGWLSKSLSAQKKFRTQQNKAKRRVVKVRLHLAQEMPHEKEYGNEWSSPRDGKYRLHKEDQTYHNMGK